MADRADSRTVEADLRSLISEMTGGAGSIVEDSLTPLTGGFDTQVFAFRVTGADPLPEQLVLRVFRHARETFRAVLEAAVHNSAADGGYPAPRVFAGSSGELIADRPFILMERARGTPLMNAAADPAAMAEIPEMMGRVHPRLHGIDPAGMMRSLERAGVDVDALLADRTVDWIAEAVDACDVAQMRPVVQWLKEHAPPAPERLSICHGDFHPGNMMVEGTRLTGIIDWANVRFGRPEFDIGVTRMLFLCGPIEDVQSEGVMRSMRAQAAAAYTHFYKEHSPLDDELITYYETLRAARAFTRVLSNRKGCKAPGRFVAPDGYAWGLPSAVRAMTGLIKRNTGISVGA